MKVAKVDGAPGHCEYLTSLFGRSPRPCGKETVWIVQLGDKWHFLCWTHRGEVGRETREIWIPWNGSGPSQPDSHY